MLECWLVAELMYNVVNGQCCMEAIDVSTIQMWIAIHRSLFILMLMLWIVNLWSCTWVLVLYCQILKLGTCTWGLEGWGSQPSQQPSIEMMKSLSAGVCELWLCGGTGVPQPVPEEKHWHGRACRHGQPVPFHWPGTATLQHRTGPGFSRSGPVLDRSQTGPVLGPPPSLIRSSVQAGPVRSGPGSVYSPIAHHLFFFHFP